MVRVADGGSGSPEIIFVVESGVLPYTTVCAHGVVVRMGALCTNTLIDYFLPLSPSKRSRQRLLSLTDTQQRCHRQQEIIVAVPVIETNR
jgi:hypothetical protein